MKFYDFIKNMRGSKPLLSFLFLQYSGRMSKDELGSFAWNSDLIPGTSASYDIGSDSNRVKTIHTESIISYNEIRLMGLLNIYNGNPITFVGGDLTPTVGGYTLFETANIIPTNITNFISGVSGQVIIIIFRDNLTSLIHGTNIMLSGGVSRNFTVEQTVMLLNISNIWYQIGGEI